MCMLDIGVFVCVGEKYQTGVSGHEMKRRKWVLNTGPLVSGSFSGKSDTENMPLYMCVTKVLEEEGSMYIK